MRSIPQAWRRNIATVFALLVIAQVGIRGVKDAYASPAFLPLIIGVEIISAMGVGAAIEMYDGAPTTSGAVGAQALSVKIVNSADGGAAQGAVRIPTTSGVASAASIPAPTGAAGSMAASTGYGSGISATCAGDNSQTIYSTQAAACAVTAEGVRYAQNANAGYSCGNPFYVSASGSAANGYCNVTLTRADNSTAQFNNIPISSVNSCPTGYTLGGSTCTLTNARAAVADGNQDLTRTGQAFAADAADLKGAVNAVLSASYVSNDTADVSGISVSGQPRMVRTVAKSDGGSEVKQITQKTDGAGQTYLETRTYIVNGEGTVTSASQGATSGTLAVSAAGTGYTVSSTGSVFTPSAPGSGSGTGGGGGSGATDYARQGEAGTAAATIVGALTAANGTFPSGATNGYGAVQSAMDGLCQGAACAADSGLNPGFSWLPSFFPGDAVGCQPLEFRGAISTGPAAGLDSTTTLDMCWMLQIVRDILGWIFNCWAIIHIWRRFTNMYSGA